MSSIVRKLPAPAMILAMTVTLAGAISSVEAQAPAEASAATTVLPEATVRELQQALNAQGIAVPVDGMLDDAMRGAIRTYQSQHHLPVTGEPDGATLTKLGVAARGDGRPAEPRPADRPAGGQGTMGMMTPEMMQMMQRMMAQRGMGQGMVGAMEGQDTTPGGMGAGRMGGQRMPEGGMGPGMMGGMGQGMGAHGPMGMSGGMTGCPMMQMMGASGGMPMMGTSGMLYGMPRDASQEMTPARVRSFLEQQLERHDNPRLKLGEVAVAADGNIIAEIVTVDGSLVQKLAFNRYPGLFRQVVE